MVIKKWNGTAWVAEYPEVDVDSIVATGTPSSTTFLRGDGAWATPSDTTTLSSLGVTATSAELNVLDGITATTAELNYTDGVTSNIQTQLNGKLSTSGKAADSNLLDGIDSGSFLRSDTSDTYTGNLTLSQNSVGTTYGNGSSATPTTMIAQTVGDNDGWRLYGEAPASNDVKMIFEVVDDNETGDTWVFRNKKTYSPYTATEDFKITGEGAIYARGVGYVNGNQRIFADNYHPNADKWTTARTITLGGDLTGSVSLDGSANVTLTAAVADDSHNHTIANVDGLQTALDNKAPLASPALTGTPTAPTAAANTNTTQIATTAYVQQEITDLIGGAPGALDTLNELAAAINDDSSYASTITTALAGKLPLAGGTMSGNIVFNDDSEGVEFYGDNAIKKLSGTGMVITTDSTRSFDTLLQLERGTGGTKYKVFHDNYHPNADKWTTARTLSLSGDASGSVSWDGSANATLSVTVNDDSHNHTIANVDGLQTALDGKAASSHTHAYVSDSGDTMTGDLTMEHDGETTANDSHGIVFTGRFNSTDFTRKLYMDDEANLLFGTETIFHSGNDGSTSGLHADLLDGQQGSYYLDYNNFSNTPTIPTNNNQLTNGAGYVTGSHSHSTSNITSGEFNTARLGSGTATSGYVLKSDGDGTASWQVDNNTTYSLGSFGVTATAAELNIMDGVTATTAELNYVDGVTSNIQTQLNSKISGNQTITLSGDASGSGTTSIAVTVNDNSHKHNASTLDIPGLWAFQYSSTTTQSDPGSGFFRLNNATQSSATGAVFDDVDYYGRPFDVAGAEMLDGAIISLYAVDTAGSNWDGDELVRYYVNTATDSEGFTTLDLKFLEASADAIDNLDIVYVRVTPFPKASSTIAGGLKARVSGTTLYLRNDTANA